MARWAIVVLLSPALVFSQVGYPRRTRGANTGNLGGYDGPAVTFQGKLKALSKKELRIDTDTEQQSITFRVTSKTHFLKDGKPIKPSDVSLEITVAVDAVRDPDQKLSARNVIVSPPKPKQPEQ
jgi:hypothetical protein